jgi:hypothetical protein
MGDAAIQIHISLRQREQLSLVHGRFDCQHGKRAEVHATRLQLCAQALFFITYQSASSRSPTLAQDHLDGPLVVMSYRSYARRLIYWC